MVPFESLVSFLFSSHSNYGSTLYRFRDKARYWRATNMIFSYALHSTPSLGGFPSEYCHIVWYGKTIMVWLPKGDKKLKTVLLTFCVTF